MSDLMDARVDAVFDALVMAGEEGCEVGDLHRLLIVNALVAPTSSRQVVRATVDRIREIFAADGGAEGIEVITCDKRAHLSRYFLALDATKALGYRRKRCQEIRTNILTIYRQVETERERFGGQRVFTAAALDYIGMALRELDRGGTLDIVDRGASGIAAAG